MDAGIEFARRSALRHVAGINPIEIDIEVQCSRSIGRDQ
jgi:hypothetical protein